MTKRHTTSSFFNELTFTLDEATELNRIAYRSATNKVGFAESFEIWTSDSESGDFVKAGEAQVSKTADMLEMKIAKALCKRVKFVFKNPGTATVSEISFYKEDVAADAMKKLFADENGKEFTAT